ncbi:MAG TPA: serine protease [Clostridium sp.]|uniref:S1 family peptidase n=1 Tax=Clostridium sp. TaxID=1506 RepID=UPI002F958E9D
MKTKQKITFIMILVSIIIILPSIKPFYNQAMNREFIENVGSNALSANIKIVQLKYSNGGNSSSIAVSAGGSGVIIRKEDNRYFALTAKHVISELDDVDKTQIVVMGYDELDFKDTLNMGGEYKGIANYYMQFPEITVEYTDAKYDLALISFMSDKVYTTLSLAEDIPKYGDKVASMSNPYGKRNIITAGKLGSKKFWTYVDKAGKIKYPIVKHSAIISGGSSGSALLNENLEIVGINLGGNEKLFHQFTSGMAMPIDRIHDFLKEWEN